jgi:transposase-like protein
MKTKNHDFKFITTVLLYLESDDFVVTRTSKKFNVHASTIGRWRDKYGDKVFQKHYEKKVVEKREVKQRPPSKPKPIGKKAALTESEKDSARYQLHKIFGSTIAGIRTEMLDKESAKKIPFRDKVTLLKEIAPYILPKFEGDDGNGGKNYENNYISYTQNIVNQFKQAGNEQRNSSIKSTPKELPFGDE